MQQTGCSALLATHYKINPMPDGLLLILFLGALFCGGWAVAKEVSSATLCTNTEVTSRLSRQAGQLSP